MKGILNKPSDADGVDTFNFGLIYSYGHDECEAKCSAKAGCAAYSQFPSWYGDGSFMSACVGRSSKNDIFEADADVLSGVFNGELNNSENNSISPNCTSFYVICLDWFSPCPCEHQGKASILVIVPNI